MSTSIPGTQKRGRGRPKTHATSIHLKLTPDLLSALNGFIASRPEPLSRPEAIRLALKDWLTSLGLLKYREEPEGSDRQ